MEAVVRALGEADDVRLVLCVHTPSGAFEQIIGLNSGELRKGDECRYSASFSPDESGTYYWIASRMPSAQATARSSSPSFSGPSVSST